MNCTCQEVCVRPVSLTNARTGSTTQLQKKGMQELRLHRTVSTPLHRTVCRGTGVVSLKPFRLRQAQTPGPSFLGKCSSQEAITNTSSSLCPCFGTGTRTAVLCAELPAPVACQRIPTHSCLNPLGGLVCESQRVLYVK